MGFSTSTCTEFVEVLASKAPVPGGGGASALVGAVGTALGNMVGSLTVGKKKYADVEDEMWELKAKCDQLQKDFLRLIERDAEVFEPLSKAYGMPKETEEEKAEKARVMEIVLKDACSVPMEIMEKCCEAIELIVEFGAKGSKLAISDAGVGAAFCKCVFDHCLIQMFRKRTEQKNAVDMIVFVYFVDSDQKFFLGYISRKKDFLTCYSKSFTTFCCSSFIRNVTWVLTNTNDAQSRVYTLSL